MEDFFRWLSQRGKESVIACFLLFGIFSYALQGVWPSEEALAVEGDAESVIIIDAGHGGMDGGTQGKNGALEKELNLSYALLLGKMLSAFGYEVIQTRRTDALVLKEGEDVYGMRKRCDLKNRKSLMREYTDGVFVSIHMNAFPIEKYKGLQVYYSDSEKAKLLAEQMQATVKKNLQADNARLPKAADSSLYLLDNASMPAVLVECGFLSNEEEEKNLMDESYQKRLCFLLLCAIMK